MMMMGCRSVKSNDESDEDDREALASSSAREFSTDR